MGGGCALNSSCNGRIVERTPFRRLHVPCAPADDGCALGAALLAFFEDHPDASPSPLLGSAYLGSSASPRALDNLTRFGGLRHSRLELPQLVGEVASLLEKGRIVGWMRGPAEFGPRALGHRSIFADPRGGDVKDRINGRVKFREEFRPLAPAVLDEHGAEYFERYQSSRYMERTLRFRAERRQEVPGVVHVDGTGRLQSVRREWSPDFHALLQEFYERTGTPLLLNTSLNVMGRPIAHSLEDTLGLFFTTGLDALVIEDVLVEKPDS
jgi:carbamoyltransferase